jgi:hypothetical protein
MRPGLWQVTRVGCPTRKRQVRRMEIRADRAGCVEIERKRDVAVRSQVAARMIVSECTGKMPSAARAIC